MNGHGVAQGPRGGRDVAGRSLLVALGMARARGADPEALCAGFPFTPADLRRRDCWLRWDDYLVVWARIEEVMGGPAGMEQGAVEMMRSSTVFRIMARLFLDPSQLYLQLATRFARAYYPSMHQVARRLDDGRIVYEMRLGREHRPFPVSWVYATSGLLRGYPRLLDLPEASVEGTHDGWSATFLVTLPDTRTLRGAWQRLVAPLPLPEPGAEDFDVASPEAVGDVLAAPPEGSMHEEGSRLLVLRDVAAIAAEVLNLLERRFLCGRSALWAATPRGSLALVEQRGAGGCATHSRTLAIAGKVVGRLDVDGEALPPTSPDYGDLETLLPWISMALARRLEGGDAEEGVAAVARRYALTAREAEVLRWLREGKTNAEIGAILGISPRTAQKHVERILEKTGTENRRAVALRTFGGNGATGGAAVL